MTLALVLATVRVNSAMSQSHTAVNIFKNSVSLFTPHNYDICVEEELIIKSVV